MVNNLKTFNLRADAKTQEELADFLKTIAEMIRDGYTSGIGVPTNWDLSESDSD